MGNKKKIEMSYHYGYYDYYGDAYYEDAPVEAEASGDSKMMGYLIWGLGAGTEFFAGLSASDDTNWDNVTASTMGNGLFRAVMMLGGMFVPAICDAWTPIAGITLVWSLANMYLVSAASIAMPMDDGAVEDDYYYYGYYYGY